MIGPIRFLLGYRRLRVPRESAGELMNLCHSHGFVYRDFSFSGEEAFFTCTPWTAHRLSEACHAREIAIEEEPVRGGTGLLRRYRRRFGIWVGLVLFAAIVFASGQFVWDVRVEGNVYVEDAEVQEALREQGLYVGCLWRRLDIDALENRVLLYSDEISWISVNLIGTVANVELREVEPISPEPPEYAAADLVAARGGVIEWFEDIRGNVAVEIGEAVGEGDLLVGGLYGREGSPARYTCARGKVFARTEHLFSVEIPLQYEKKTYTERVSVEKYLIFFEKEVKFFSNCGNLPPSCDTINTVEYFQTHGGTRLPFGVRTVRHYEYEQCVGERGEEAALNLAYDALNASIASQTSEAMLVGKKIETAWSDTALMLRCRLECIEDIASPREIKIEGISD